MKSDDWRKRVVCDPEIRGGEPCIRGTRIPVSILVASLAEMSIDELLREYPQLARKDIQAALLYASETAQEYRVAVGRPAAQEKGAGTWQSQEQSASP